MTAGTGNKQLLACFIH